MCAHGKTIGMQLCRSGGARAFGMNEREGHLSSRKMG